MENEMHEGSVGVLDQMMARLTAVVELLERTLPRTSIAASETIGPIGPIVAMVEGGREAELMQKLASAEKTIAELRSSAALREGRKTLPVSLLAKQDGGAAEAGAIDAALTSLSMEQRIAVKSQLLRAGLI